MPDQVVTAEPIVVATSASATVVHAIAAAPIVVATSTPATVVHAIEAPPIEVFFQVGATRNAFLYVVDSGNNRVQAFEYDGTYAFEWGTLGSGPGEFDAPYDVATNGEMVYVSDTGNQRIQAFDLYGNFLWETGSLGSGWDQFNGPYGIAADGRYVYVVDKYNNRVSVFSAATGQQIVQVGSYGTGFWNLITPTDIAVDSLYMYIDDTGNSRVQIWPLSWLPKTYLDSDLPALSISASGYCASISAGIELPVIIEASGSVSVATLSSASIELPAMTAVGYTGARADTAVGLPALELSASADVTKLVDAAIVLPLLETAGQTSNNVVVTAAIEIPALSGAGVSLVGSIAVGAVVLPALSLSSVGYSGVVASGAIVLPALSSSVDILLQVDISGFTVELPALSLRAFMHHTAAAPTYATIVVNTKTTANTNYTNYPFSGMAYLAGKTYLAGPSGLFVYDGSHDQDAVDLANNTNITARITTGYIDFHAGYGDVPNILRKAREAWIVGRQDGRLQMSVLVDEGTTYVYDIVDIDPQINDIRVKFARGTDGRHFMFSIVNTNGCNFDIRSVRVKAESFSNRRR